MTGEEGTEGDPSGEEATEPGNGEGGSAGGPEASFTPVRRFHRAARSAGTVDHVQNDDQSWVGG
jgi:hypothetical protein